MFDILKDIGYIKITYDDNTSRVVRTTLNQLILNRYGITDLEENIFDLDRQVLVPIEGTIEIHENKPEVNEFDLYVSRFL